jgi:hypothetical protein
VVSSKLNYCRMYADKVRFSSCVPRQLWHVKVKVLQYSRRIIQKKTQRTWHWTSQSLLVMLITVSRCFIQEVNWGFGSGHPVLSVTLPVYLPQISLGTQIELGRHGLSLQSHATDPCYRSNIRWHQDTCLHGQRISSLAC